MEEKCEHVVVKINGSFEDIKKLLGEIEIVWDSKDKSRYYNDYVMPWAVFYLYFKLNYFIEKKEKYIKDKTNLELLTGEPVENSIIIMKQSLRNKYWNEIINIPWDYFYKAMDEFNINFPKKNKTKDQIIDYQELTGRGSERRHIPPQKMFSKIRKYIKEEYNFIIDEYCIPEKWSEISVYYKSQSDDDNKSNELDNNQTPAYKICPPIPSKKTNKEYKLGIGKTVSLEKQLKKDKRNQEQGDKAEEEIYFKLLKNEIAEVRDFFQCDVKDSEVHWVSGAAGRKQQEIEVRLGKNIVKPPFDDTLGYDIFIEVEQKKLYIEVKSSKEYECEFYMSDREFVWAKDHSENYVVIFVGGLKKEYNEKRISVIDMRFWENENEYSVKPCKFEIKKSETFDSQN